MGKTKKINFKALKIYKSPDKLTRDELVLLGYISVLEERIKDLEDQEWYLPPESDTETSPYKMEKIIFLRDLEKIPEDLRDIIKNIPRYTCGQSSSGITQMRRENSGLRPGDYIATWVDINDVLEAILNITY